MGQGRRVFKHEWECELPGVDVGRSSRVKVNVWKDDFGCKVVNKNRKNGRMTVRLLNMQGLTKQKWK